MSSFVCSKKWQWLWCHSLIFSFWASCRGGHCRRLISYLIIVIFFTLTQFLENKIYTQKTRKLRQNTQKIANFLRYDGKIHSKLPIFSVKSVKIYTGQKKFTRACSWRSWQISGMIPPCIYFRFWLDLESSFIFLSYPFFKAKYCDILYAPRYPPPGILVPSVTHAASSVNSPRIKSSFSIYINIQTTIW